MDAVKKFQEHPIFPNGAIKALTFGFDDGEIYDRRLCDMMRGYGLKGTFFLVTDRLGQSVPFHRYGRDTLVRFVSRDELRETYRGMEIASHTATHVDCRGLDADALYGEIKRSYELIGKVRDTDVKGFAYPGGGYDDRCVEVLRRDGVDYARTTGYTQRFDIPDDFLRWHPTCRVMDENIYGCIDRFINDPEEGGIFYIMGHSFEFTKESSGRLWDELERIMQLLAGRGDIWYATNAEIFESITAYGGKV